MFHQNILLSLFGGILLVCSKCIAQTIHESDINFRVEAGSRTCFFERGRAGQMMEAYYQVLDGQHGDLDITFEIIDPTGAKLVSDYKRAQNSIIMDLAADGDYVFCMDNSYSMMNSKLVFVYVVIEDKAGEGGRTEAAAAGEEEEVLEWTGLDERGEAYYVEVAAIAAALTRTLRHVARARQLLELHGAGKARDSYVAFEDTFVVDVWSAFQICFMMVVGMIQVYMIKKMFSKSENGIDGYH